MRAWTTGYHVALALALAGGCSGDDASDATDQTDGGGPLEAVCTDPTDIPCEDAIISDLSLQDDKISDGKVENTADGADFVTEIDATAGGFGQETQNAWVYVKFTESGAEKVRLDDEEALTSMDWDLAARRFILRLNGGSSGPSCVGAAPFLEKSYDELTEVPGDTTFRVDDYYTGDCSALINDSSGLEGSPQVALSAWWEYPGCVKTTGTPFLVQLADGHVIKLRVEQYYTEQQVCNQDSVPSGESGRIELRWTFLK